VRGLFLLSTEVVGLSKRFFVLPSPIKSMSLANPRQTFSAGPPGDQIDFGPSC
jgi:hypothetical protein